MRAETKRELAFIKDFYLAEDWTQKFTSAIEEKVIFQTTGKLLYLEAGTGNHALELREKLKPEVEIFALESDTESLRLAEAKAQTLRAKINFKQSAPAKTGFSAAEFKTVLGDFSFTPREDFAEIITEMLRVAEKEATIAFFLPTAGSFGEFFSIFWEALYNEDLTEHGAAIESLITEQTKVSDIEEIAEKAGLREIETFTTSQNFDYATGKDFLGAPLVENYLLPLWTAKMPKEICTKALENIADLIDKERAGMSFQISLKASLVVGKK